MSTSNSIFPRRRKLGQFMTPECLADLLVHSLPLETECVLDLAAGKGALLLSAKKHRELRAVGIDLDERYAFPKQVTDGYEIFYGDGLLYDVSNLSLPENTIIIGNPPYSHVPRPGLSTMLREALPTLAEGLNARCRSEIYFLARSLLLSRRYSGKVSIVLPITFAAGESFRQYRSALMKSWHITKAIELPGGCFVGTEARTIILNIEEKKGAILKTEIQEFNPCNGRLKLVATIHLTPGDRFDAAHHKFRQTMPQKTLTLSELGATVERGRVTRKFAEVNRVPIVHTSDLRRLNERIINLPTSYQISTSKEPQVFAETGDILLPRTGKRVDWRPVYVESGSSPITDHVFRIRAPRTMQEEVRAAFSHPRFLSWIEGTISGVCASVLAKKDLLNMPIFAKEM